MGKVKDCLGNELTVNDRVHVLLSSTSAIASILEIKSGGLSLIQGAKNIGKGQQGVMTPGTVDLLVKVTVPFDPRSPQLINVVRVVTPEDGDDAEKKKGSGLVAG